VAKFSTDQTGPTLRECTDVGGPLLTGALQLNVVEARVTAPQTFTTAFGVVSFGRNLSGTRIETFAGGASTEATVTPTDVSASGNPFGIGGLISQGTPEAPYGGKVNRLYVFHAPPGTFTSADFETIRTYVANAAPLP
jgi:hypothetical protein